MTRPIKYRMWAKSPSAYWIEAYGRMMYDYTSKILFECLGFWSDDECEYMQFTGLLDKNGKEIYESDIIKDERGSIYSVNFTAPCFFFEENGTKYIFEQYAIEVHGMEIIGNVLENPELLTNP